MIQQRHVIKQQILELQVSSDANTFELQNQISFLYRSQIVPLIEVICNQLSHPDTIHRIDRLEIDLGEINAESLETDFTQKATEALSRQLTEILAAMTVQTTRSTPQAIADATLSVTTEQARKSAPVSPTQVRFELLRDFIQTGRLPWWSEPLDRNGLENCFTQLLADSPDKLKVLLQSSLKEEKILQRILYQFSESMRVEMLKLLAPALQPIFHAYLQDMQRLVPYVKSFQKFGFEHLSQTIWQGVFLQFSLRESFSYPSTKPEIDAILRANLLHIVTQLNVNWRSLIQNLLSTIEQLKKAGTSFDSELPQVLVTIDLTSLSPQAVSKDISQNQGQTDAIAQIATTPTLPLDSNSQDNPAIVSQQRKVSQNQGQKDAIAQIATTPTLPLDSNSWDNPAIVSQYDEPIYIQNSGLILLWPFLNNFFETLGLVAQRQFLTLEATHRAVLILQYLVDASVESLELVLPLNKLLCALDLSTPIAANLTISESEQNECEALLFAVIQNWSALRNISIAGFRRAFLQRAGILRQHRDGWLLQIEHQTHDILIDQIPWSIRLIKLPWMLELLHIEW